MPIAVVGSFVNSGGTPTVAVSVSGFQAGDLAVALTYVINTSALDPLITTPTDNQSNVWTERTKSVWGSAIDESQVSICDAIIAATGPTTVTVRSTNSESTVGRVLRVTGHDVTRYFDVALSGASTNTTFVPTPALNPVAPGIRLFIQALTSVGGSHNLSSMSMGYATEQGNPLGRTNAWATKVAVAAGIETPNPRWVTNGSTDDYQASAVTYRQAPGPSDYPDPRIGWVGA